MSQRGLKSGDLDLDLQGQIGLETKNIVLFLVSVTTFESWEFYLQN